MEYWDIYDRQRVKTGRVMERDDWSMASGEYHISVTGLIQKPDGRYLITQRKDDKPWGAGWWEFPGGAVLAGENPCEAVVREVSEETGLDFSGIVPEHIYTYERCNDVEHNNYFMDLFRLALDFELADVHVQKAEIADFKLASVNEITELGHQGFFMHFDSIQSVFTRA